jgi:hypothetical protein
MLLQALSGGSDAGERVGTLGDVGWAQRAVNVYREFLSAGHKPAPHVVERVLACLRQPLPPKPSTPPSLVAPFQVRNALHAQDRAVLRVHDSRSFSGSHDHL